MNHGVAQGPLETLAVNPRTLRHGAIALRSAQEIDAIAAAGAVVAAALESAVAQVRVGVTTSELDAQVRATIAALGAEPAFLNYPNPSGGAAFPAAACISVNEELVHGIPGARVLCAGDILSIDVGVRLDGWYADAAVTAVVPGADPARAAALEAFVANAWETLHAGIAAMQPGVRWSAVAARMQRVAIAHGHGVVDGWYGHGVGRAVHEAPQAPAVVSAGLREERDFTLLPGMVLAVEPILVLGARSAVDEQGNAASVAASQMGDGWTVAVAPGLFAAHVEHTVAMTRSGPRILTRRTPARAAECTVLNSPVNDHGGRCRNPG